YTLLGDRQENSNEDITDVGTELFRLTRLTGAGVLFVHHFSKGSQALKRGIEKASGAGSWGRFPDVSLAIDRHPGDKHCYNFEATTRTFFEQAEFVARRINGIWAVDDKMKVEHKETGIPELRDMLDILRNAPNGEMSPSEWLAAYQEQIDEKANRRTF